MGCGFRGLSRFQIFRRDVLPKSIAFPGISRRLPGDVAILQKQLPV
jgi:hypothetical protein